MKLLHLLLLAIVVVALGAAAPATQSGLAFSHAGWNQLLARNVKDGLVDYAAFAGTDRAALAAYLSSIAKADVPALSHQEQLALYLNLYNAAMISAVVDRYQPEYSVMEGKMKIFTEPCIRLGGATVTLDHVEHELIRKGFNDPRVHAAMVCGGMSCPPLQSWAFEGNRIDQQLDEVMRLWLNDPRHNRINPVGKRVTLSKIFKWYAKDFGGPESLPGVVRKYTGQDVTGFAIGFFQYDWRLNDLSPDGRPETREVRR